MPMSMVEDILLQIRVMSEFAEERRCGIHAWVLEFLRAS